MLNDTITYELFRNTEIWKGHGEIFLSDPFWMIRGFNIRGREFLFPAQPYLLQERRVVWVKKGWAVYSFNLVEHRFEAGNLVVIYGDTLVEKKGRSSPWAQSTRRRAFSALMGMVSRYSMVFMS